MANGDSEFGIITGNLSNRKNVPRKMRRYSEYGGESSGDNLRVACTCVFYVSFVVGKIVFCYLESNEIRTDGLSTI